MHKKIVAIAALAAFLLSGLLLVKFWRHDDKTVTEYVNVPGPTITKLVVKTVSPHPVPTVTVTEHPKPSAPPKTKTVLEKPKYDKDSDYDLSMVLSSTPLVNVTWTGNSMPFVNVYIKSPPGWPAFNDTGLAVIAILYNDNEVGYDLCVGSGNPIYLYNFTVVNPGGGLPITYASTPLPQNPYDLLGTGNNCYSRAVVSSDWTLYVCIEGDGSITPPYWSVDANKTAVYHFDPWDDCRHKTQHAGAWLNAM